LKAIIFGSNGQDGYYLNSLLKDNNVEVIGISRGGDWYKGDVSDWKTVQHYVQTYKPDYIFHLAANSTTRHDALFENHETISTGTLNILEAAYKFSPSSKIFISGSGLQFVNHGIPISENDPFEANSPYSIARIQSVYAARYYRSLGLTTYVGYLFHHDSPRRSERHLNMKIVKAALRTQKGNPEVIEIGNIDVVKEYNYAGDIVNAIWILINQDNIFETVIGSGKGYAIRDWLRICFENVGLNWEGYVRLRKDYKPEFMKLISHPTTLLSIGWTPKVGIQQLADKMMAI
jgi:GDPmannose 4,6-dehydratase